MRVELRHVISSDFKASMYSMFGFLLLAFLTQIIIISLLSCITTYLQLNNQDYQWWWKSFIIGASGSLYIALELAY